MPSNNSFKDMFLAQFRSIDLRSREFPNTLTKMLASQEGVNAAMSLRGDDALILVDILDQAFEAPNEFGLKSKIVHILRRVCGSQTILPRSCVLSENISKEGDIASASRRFTDVWKGRHNGDCVCVKALRPCPPRVLPIIKQRLFQEIVIWRHLSHPNVLPVLGVPRELSPLCIITAWMIEGDIMDFTSRHPEVCLLRLLARAASGLEYLHSMEIIHGDLKPTNILIDNDFLPRLTDYGLTPILSDPNTIDPGGVTSPPIGTVRYMAPELLNPRGFGLKSSNPTKESDIYAFGMVAYQVITRQQPFPGAESGVITRNAIAGERPCRPLGPNEWLSNDVWNFISRCWSPSRDDRPDVHFAINTLDDAANAYPATNPGTRTSRRVSGSLPPSPDLSKRQVGVSPTQQTLQHSTQTSRIPETPSPAGSGATRKERREVQTTQLGFRLWRDSSGSPLQEMALVDYHAGIVHLSSFDGTLLAIPEGELCREDLNCVRSQDVYKMGKHDDLRRGMSPALLRIVISRNLTGSGDTTDLEQLDNLRRAVRYPHVPSENQPPTPDTTSPSSATPTTPMAQLELWEADLTALLRMGKAGVQTDLGREKAQEFADRLGAAIDNKDLDQERKQYASYLRKLCCTFDILPSSFILSPAFDERGAMPFASGGFSDIYEATLDGRRVAVKVLKVNTQTIKSVRRLLIKEVIGWRWIRHENILPFIGVSLKPPLFSIISERMENGNIMNFVEAHPNYNRLRLLAGAVTGLEYLHEHGIVHGDLKGGNILIDSECCARLADFGLAVITDESTTGSTVSNRELKGTVRWMAPELLLPEQFGFTGELLKQLPSTSTDIYAIGMTIFEVLTGYPPFIDCAKTYTVIYKVVNGDRPNRPALGFSDILWELLAATWVVEDGPGSKRPPASTVLDRLQQDVNHWGNSIVPLVPKEWQESGCGKLLRSKQPGGGWWSATSTTGPVTIPLTRGTEVSDTSRTVPAIPHLFADVLEELRGTLRKRTFSKVSTNPLAVNALEIYGRKAAQDVRSLIPGRSSLSSETSMRPFAWLMMREVSLFGSSEESCYAMREGEGAIQLWLAGDAQVDMYEVVTSLCRLLFHTYMVNDALLFTKMLSMDLRTLRRLGYNVDRILKQQKAGREAAPNALAKGKADGGNFAFTSAGAIKT